MASTPQARALRPLRLILLVAIALVPLSLWLDGAVSRALVAYTRKVSCGAAGFTHHLGIAAPSAGSVVGMLPTANLRTRTLAVWMLPSSTLE